MELDFEFMEKTFGLLWSGVPVTLGITLLSLLLAAPFAFYFALGRIQGNKALTYVSRGYVSFVRGTPVVLQILLLYSLLPSLLNALVVSLGLDFNVFESVEPFYYAVVVFTLNTIALLTEVFRSALMSVPKGQLEAGLSIGLSEFQTYLRVIIPQALVSALPGICNITVNLVKGSSLAFLMTVKDIMAVGKIAASFGYNYIEAYLDVFLVYIILCSIVQLLYAGAEKRLGAYRVL
ncbi:MAG: amino acid ABC transporter permease [Anaerovibrio sp.]